jgi:hypothetical protein
VGQGKRCRKRQTVVVVDPIAFAIFAVRNIETPLLSPFVTGR